jgi:hypothetical protein
MDRSLRRGPLALALVAIGVGAIAVLELMPEVATLVDAWVERLPAG